jgi:hypothetical protein
LILRLPEANWLAVSLITKSRNSLMYLWLEPESAKQENDYSQVNQIVCVLLDADESLSI